MPSVELPDSWKKQLAAWVSGLVLAGIGWLVQHQLGNLVHAIEENSRACRENTQAINMMQAQAQFESDAHAAKLRLHIAEGHEE